MAENLNVGTMILGTSNQTDNVITEKYCYNGDVNICATDGGLYRWHEMMQYSITEGAQGLCPAGWHIPTDDEWKTLEMELGMSSEQANLAGYRGTNQGAQLKEGGPSGFEALLAGLIDDSVDSTLRGLDYGVRVF